VQFIPTNVVRVRREAKLGDHKAFLLTQDARVDIPVEVNKKFKK